MEEDRDRFEPFERDEEPVEDDGDFPVDDRLEEAEEGGFGPPFEVARGRREDVDRPGVDIVFVPDDEGLDLSGVAAFRGEADAGEEEFEGVPLEMEEDPITVAVRGILMAHCAPYSDTRQLKDMGGGHIGVRTLIAHDIDRAFPDLNPRFRVADVRPTDTLGSLSGRVSERLVA